MIFIAFFLTYPALLIAEPHDEELVECPIERGTMRLLLHHGKNLLNVHEDQFEDSVRHQLVKKALTEAFASESRLVKSLPLAGERSKVNRDYVTWSGVDTILGDYILAKDAQGRNRFKLIPEFLVVKLICDPKIPGKVMNAVVRNLRTGNKRGISARVGYSSSLGWIADDNRILQSYVVVCGVICSPQLLWNSNIRHESLGRYLTYHSHSFCQVCQCIYSGSLTYDHIIQ